ncbi:14599_t:CDS:2, partial [Gigaspora rosea]
AGNAGYGIVTDLTLSIYPIQKVVSSLYFEYDFDQTTLVFLIIESDNVDCEGKKNMDINKLNKRESNSTKVINSKNVPMKSDHQVDMFEVVDNGGEAADGKANEYQYENGIGNEKDEHTKLTTFKCCSGEARDLEPEYKNKELND